MPNPSQAVMPTASGASRTSAVPTSNQWTVKTELNQKQFPDLSSLVVTAKNWATENMFSLFKLHSDKDKVDLACSHGNTGHLTMEETL